MNRFRPYRRKSPFALALLIAALAVLISLFPSRGTIALRLSLQSVLAPVNWLTANIFRASAGLPVTLAGLTRVEQQNAALRTQLAGCRAEKSVLDELKNENERLRSALDFSRQNSHRYKLSAVQVIGRAPAPWFSVLTIDRGSDRGVKPGQAVIAQQGLVGQIIEAAPTTAKVLLLIDPASSIAAADSRSRDLGVLTGSLAGKLFFKYVAADGDVRVGDLITTAGISTLFPPGIPIGLVTRASKKEHDLFYQIEVRPMVDLSTLEELFVLL